MLFWDQWSIVEPVVNKKIDLNMLQYQHNEHRIGTGLIVIKLLAMISNWNNLVETMFEGFMFLIIAIICFCYFKLWSLKKYELIDLSVPLIIFNLNQWGNLTWGFQIAFVLPLLFLFINLYLFEKRNNKIYDIAILLIGVLSSRSSFHGIFVPFISALYYFFLIIKGNKIKFSSILWIVLNLLAVGSYFVGFGIDNLNHKINFISILKYTVSLINNFVGYRHLDWIGLLFPGYAAWFSIKYFLKYKKRTEFFIIGMMCFSLLFMLTTSIGRSNLGIEQAFSSRYNTAIFPLCLSIYFIVKKIGSKASKLFFGLLMLIVFFQGFYLAKHDLFMYAFKTGTDAWKKCYLKKENAQFCQNETKFLVYPDIIKLNINEKLRILKKSKMNLYASEL